MKTNLIYFECKILRSLSTLVCFSSFFDAIVFHVYSLNAPFFVQTVALFPQYYVMEIDFNRSHECILQIKNAIYSEMVRQNCRPKKI